MPRRNYSKDRQRPHGYDGEALRKLEQWYAAQRRPASPYRPKESD